MTNKERAKRLWANLSPAPGLLEVEGKWIDAREFFREQNESKHTIIEEALNTFQAEIESKWEVCWICGGRPSISNILCICGGTGKHIDEVDGLRRMAAGLPQE